MYKSLYLKMTGNSIFSCCFILVSLDPYPEKTGMKQDYETCSCYGTEVLFFHLVLSKHGHEFSLNVCYLT